MNEKQQTAVQWLYKKMQSVPVSIPPSFKKWIDQALAMEREQKILAHINGQEHKTPFIYDYDAAEQYFTNTYHTEP